REGRRLRRLRRAAHPRVRVDGGAGRLLRRRLVAATGPERGHRRRGPGGRRGVREGGRARAAEPPPRKGGISGFGEEAGVMLRPPNADGDRWMTTVVSNSPARILLRPAAALILALALALPAGAQAASQAKQPCPAHASSCAKTPASTGGIKPLKTST